MEPVSTGQAAKDYLTRTVTPTLLKGLTELCKMKPADPIVSLHVCNLYRFLMFKAFFFFYLSLAFSYKYLQASYNEYSLMWNTIAMASC